MKNFLIGLCVGFIIGGAAIAYADLGVLFGSNNVEKGTATNPLYIEFVE